MACMVSVKCQERRLWKKEENLLRLNIKENEIAECRVMSRCLYCKYGEKSLTSVRIPMYSGISGILGGGGGMGVLVAN